MHFLNCFNRKIFFRDISEILLHQAKLILCKLLAWSKIEFNVRSDKLLHSYKSNSLRNLQSICWKYFSKPNLDKNIAFVNLSFSNFLKLIMISKVSSFKFSEWYNFKTFNLSLLSNYKIWWISWLLYSSESTENFYKF